MVRFRQFAALANRLSEAYSRLSLAVEWALALERADRAFAPLMGKAMMPNGSVDSNQLLILAKVLDEYCRQAGIGAGHAARERLGRRVMELFQGGMDKSAELHAAMNSSYAEWLGEVDRLPSSSQQPVLWAIDPAITEPSCAETVDLGGGGALRFPQADAVEHSANSSPHPSTEEL
ncbi:hypothetical protein [Mesorhizobium carmichaelinearum]|uniref:hypothetical protein n=1 Tax=Mesorhizobium carmichaelinearum TaxID=1208188 RepID=UPI0011813E9A|nr:hypothetical protein [Mesorhizobium carmichaelinearum]